VGEEEAGSRCCRQRHRDLRWERGRSECDLGFPSASKTTYVVEPYWARLCSCTGKDTRAQEAHEPRSPPRHGHLWKLPRASRHLGPTFQGDLLPGGTAAAGAQRNPGSASIADATAGNTISPTWSSGARSRSTTSAPKGVSFGRGGKSPRSKDPTGSGSGADKGGDAAAEPAPALLRRP
jgi:hypothetical protein